MNWKNLSLILSILFVGSACVRIDPEEPNYGDFQAMPVQEVSVVNIPVSLPIDQITQLVNAKLKKVLYEDKSFENNGQDNLKIKITRLSKLKIRGHRGRLYVTVPLQVEAVALISQKVLKKEIKKEQALQFSIDLHLSSSYALRPDWHLETHTRLEKMEWRERPDIKVMFLKFDLSKMIEKKLKEKEGELLTNLDEVIRKNVSLAPTMEKLWVDIHKPIVIRKKAPEVYLHVLPEDLRLSPLRVKGNALEFQMQLDARLYSEVNGKEPRGKPTSLPSFQSKTDTTTNIQLRLLGSLPFEEINKVLRDSLRGREFAMDEHAITIKAAKMYGSGDKVVLRLEVAGDAKGTVFLSGTPVYHTDSALLRVEDFNFDMRSEEILLNMADWLFHTDLLDKIRSKLSWPIGARIQQVPTLIENGINSGKHKERLSLAIDTLHVQPTLLTVRPEGLYFLIEAQGRAQLKLTQLKK